MPDPKIEPDVPLRAKPPDYGPGDPRPKKKPPAKNNRENTMRVAVRVRGGGHVVEPTARAVTGLRAAPV